MLRITLLILIVLPSVILAGCYYGKVVTCPSGDPCTGVTSSYCEHDACDNCVARCFDKKGGEQLPCERKKCTVKSWCWKNPCDAVRDKDCKSSCASCKPICYGDDGKQIHCTMKKFVGKKAIK